MITMITDQQVRRLWDARNKISSKNGALNEDERKCLAKINETLESYTFDLMDYDSTTLTSEPIIDAIKMIINHHVKTFMKNKDLASLEYVNICNNALSYLYYTAWNFMNVISPMISGTGHESVTLLSSNVYYTVCDFIAEQLNIKAYEVSEHNLFKWVHK